jgi:UvrD/REP helicase N-terminal domain
VGAIEAFEKLNPRQREAACAGAAPLLIVAGAGTGKTNTLAHRVAHWPSPAARRSRGHAARAASWPK